MPSTKHQKQFERWALSKELSVEHHPNPEKGFDYYDIETQMFWECWCAAQVDDEETTLAYTKFVSGQTDSLDL